MVNIFLYLNLELACDVKVKYQHGLLEFLHIGEGSSKMKLATSLTKAIHAGGKHWTCPKVRRNDEHNIKLGQT